MSFQVFRNGEVSIAMRGEVLLVVDVQKTFHPPEWLVSGVSALAGLLPSVATVERHDESRTPFKGQLGWSPSIEDDCLVPVDQVFVKYGYAPPRELVEHLSSLEPERVLVCGIQTDCCVLAAGFALFDAGLYPTLLTDLTIGSSVDRSATIGTQLWRHHFRRVTTSRDVIAQRRPD